MKACGSRPRRVLCSRGLPDSRLGSRRTAAWVVWIASSDRVGSACRLLDMYAAAASGRRNAAFFMKIGLASGAPLDRGDGPALQDGRLECVRVRHRLHLETALHLVGKDDLDDAFSVLARDDEWLCLGSPVRVRISGWLVAGCPDRSGSCPGRHRLGNSGGEALDCRSSLARGHAVLHEGPFCCLHQAPIGTPQQPRQSLPVGVGHRSHRGGQRVRIVGPRERQVARGGEVHPAVTADEERWNREQIRCTLCGFAGSFMWPIPAREL